MVSRGEGPDVFGSATPAIQLNMQRYRIDDFEFCASGNRSDPLGTR